MSKRPINIEDLLAIRWLSEPQISPDGTRVVYVQKQMNRERDTYFSHLWLVDLDGEQSAHPRQLTFGDHQNALPRWSPDGRTIAFLSNGPVSVPPGSRQIYLLSPDGGEPDPITRGFLNPDDLAWSPDGGTIAFVGRIPAAQDASLPGLLTISRGASSDARLITRLAYRSDREGFWDGTCRQIFVLPMAGGEARQLTEGDFDHREPAWSSDGRLIAFVANDAPDGDATFIRDLWVVPTDGGEPRRLTQSLGPCSSPSWSPGGEVIAYLGHNQAHGPATSTTIWLAHLDGTPPRNLTVSFDRPFAYHINSDMRELAPKRGWPAWSRDGKRLVAPFESGGTHQLAAVDPSSGTVTPLTSARREIFAYSFDSSGTRGVIAVADPLMPGDIWSIAFDAAGQVRERRITAVNQDLIEHVALSRPKRFTFESEGVEIEGWILPPLDVVDGLKYPAVLQIHGGPHSSYGETFVHEWQVLAAEGIASIYTNPRGSQGYGQDFSAAIRHGWGEKDYEDLMRAVDIVVESFPYVDGDRLGVTGGSYGGFMTNWIVGHTNRFKAAISERSISNLSSHSTSSDMPLVQGSWSFPGDPWESPEWYWRHSPLAYVSNARTPLLLVHSEHDFRCPITEAEQFYGALKKRGCAVAFLRFPGENHDLSRTGKPSRRLDRLYSVLSWFICYLPADVSLLARKPPAEGAHTG